MNRTTNKRPLKRNDQFDMELFTAENPQSDEDSKSKRIRYSMMGQVLPEQGWQHCQAGFDGVSTVKEEEERRGLHQLKSRGAKRVSLSSTKPAQEGSSLEIDWSSSSESLSDVEPLPQEPPSAEHPRRASHKKRIIRKSRGKTRLHHGVKLRSVRLGVAAGEEDEVDIVEDHEEEGVKRGVASGGEGSKTTSTTKQGQSTLEEKKSSQIHISDYDSPSEDPFNLTSSSQQGSSSLHISDHSPTPQPSPVHSPSKESPRTGTELLKRLKLPERTPDKEGATGGPSGGGDSAAKKKKKFVRGGLAEDLQRVMNREKSSMAFWSHRTVDTTATNQSPALDLLVLSLEEVRGLFITRCQMQPVTSEVNEEMFVLFSQANGRQLKLGLGSRVRVHPPWQKLMLPNYKQPVILCTHFCQSVDDDGTEGVEQTENQSSLFPNVMSGPSLGEQLRPLQLFQPRPIPAQTTTKSTLQSVLPQSTEAPKGHVSDSFLDSIAQTGMYSPAGMCVLATIHRVYYRRCHPEATLASRKFPSYSHAVPAKQSTQWTLLIQDSQGVFCELQVTLAGTGEEEEEEWRRCLRHGEGKTFIFSGLKVMRRVNRTRSPGLFSLIDSMWSPCEGTSQTDSESQDSKSQGLVSPQSFCYILGVQTLKNSIREDGTHRVRIPYREPVIHTLGEIEKMSDICNQRVACYAKLVYAHPVTDPHTASQQPESQTHTTDWHLFLTDHTLAPIAELATEKKSGNVTGILGDEGREGRGTRLMYVYVRRSCSAVECARDCLGVPGSLVPGSLVLLRDVCCEQGHLHADTYTTIDKLTENETQEETERKRIPQDGIIISRLSALPIPLLPDLVLHSDQHTLVSISGVVTGVDEASAYSWPACDTCGNDRLQVDPNSGSVELHCKVCQRSVTSPSTRMHLEITLDTPAIGHGEAKIKVQLLQSSIEQVLPPLSSQEDGYDMQCIMGITIGPISCFLRTVSRQPGEPVNFDLEEVSLEP